MTFDDRCRESGSASNLGETPRLHARAWYRLENKSYQLSTTSTSIGNVRLVDIGGGKRSSSDRPPRDATIHHLLLIQSICHSTLALD